MHKYGPHIFHTNSKEVFDYLSRFTQWRPYEHRVLASVDGQLVPIPINLDTVNRLYGLNLSSEELPGFFAQMAVAREPLRTSEDVVVSKVGRDLYGKFFRGYTRKQWGLDPSELDASVTARVPTRTNRDDRYFTDTYQAMPPHGYTRMFERMLDHPNINVVLHTDYHEIASWVRFRHMIYTGPVDEYFDYRFGKLPYRSLEFEHETLDASAVPGDRHGQLPERARLHADHRVQAPHRPGARDDELVYEYPQRRGRPVLPGAAAGERRALPAVPGARGAAAERALRRPAGDVPVLQHGPGGRQALTLFGKLGSGRGEAGAAGVDGGRAGRRHARRGVVSDRHGYPRPQLVRAAWASLNGPWEFALDPDARWNVPPEVGWDRTIVVPFAPETRGERHRRRRASTRRAGTAAASTARTSRPGERLLLHFGAVDYSATVWVNGRGRGTPRGRLHAVHAPTSRASSLALRSRRSWCARSTTRTTSPSRAASRTGSSSRTRSGTRARPASGRRSGWSGCRRAACRGAALDAEPRAVGDRVRGAASTASRARSCSCACGCTSTARRCSRRQLRGGRRRGAPAHRLLRPRHRRLPQRAAVEPDQPDADRRASLQLLDARRPRGRRGRELHGAALGRRSRATASCSTAARTSCAWCSTRATGPRAG